MILKESESISVIGGATGFTAALISAVNKVISTIYSYGQNLGSAIIRLIRKNAC